MTTDSPNDGSTPYVDAGLDTLEQGRSPVAVVLTAVLGIGALIGAGLFAISAFNSASAGADSPEEAIDTLFAAIDEEDLVGVLDAMAPAERDLLVDPAREINAELQRLGLLREGTDLENLPGFDLEFSDLTYSSTYLSQRVATVTVEGGTVRAEAFPAEIPIGDLLEDLGGEELQSELDALPRAASVTEEIPAGELELVAILEDGSWYFSGFYSLAEVARREAGAPVPTFDGALAPAGADSPEGAVQALMDRAVDLDMRGIVQILPPDEMAAMYDYAPLFLDDAEAAVADMRREADFDITVERLDMEATGSGSVRTVEITGFAGSLTAEGVHARVDFDGECVTYSYVDEWSEDVGHTCLDELEELDPMFGGLGTLRSSVSGRLTVVEVDGAWYVSPTRSVLDPGLEALRQLERQTLEDLFAGVGGIGEF